MKPSGSRRDHLAITQRLGIGTACALSALMVAACISPKPVSTLTPPAALIEGDPWSAARKLSSLVPNSTVMVGHGDSMLPLYPSGTVLVLQRLDWAHLREGMTVVFFRDVADRFSLSGGILVREEDGRWYTSGADGDAMNLTVQSENYMGTVVAAFRSGGSPGANEFMRTIPMDQAQTCLLRCHVN
jgi:hypothetical protein